MFFHLSVFSWRSAATERVAAKQIASISIGWGALGAHTRRRASWAANLVGRAAHGSYTTRLIRGHAHWALLLWHTGPWLHLLGIDRSLLHVRVRHLLLRRWAELALRGMLSRAWVNRALGLGLADLLSTINLLLVGILTKKLTELTVIDD